MFLALRAVPSIVGIQGLLAREELETLQEVDAHGGAVLLRRRLVARLDPIPVVGVAGAKRAFELRLVVGSQRLESFG
jgi:hypothetical protein